MKLLKSVLAACAAMLLLLPPGAIGEESMVPVPEKIVYGQSVLGRELVCWRVGPDSAERSVLMVFAVHGFEDEFAADGALLCRIAEETLQFYAAEPHRLNGFSLYIVPCANPDGLLDGTSNRGFGRCNADGYDINRDFPVNFQKNQIQAGKKTGAEPFTTPEAAALRDLVTSIRPTYALDVHGYIETVYCGSDAGRAMARPFADSLGFPVRSWSAGGMQCAWLDTVTDGALLIELRTPLKERSRNGGSASDLWMPLDDFVQDQGGKLRAGLEEWLRQCGE